MSGISDISLKKLATGKLKEIDIDRELCRAVARTLWFIFPKMTIKAIAEHIAIQKFANCRKYTGKHTIRNWIKDLNPNSSKGGRPLIC